MNKILKNIPEYANVILTQKRADVELLVISLINVVTHILTPS